jgi:hypothetical protein
MNTKDFTATVDARANGGIAIKLPFDPSAEWGDKDRHDVTGAIGGHKVRGRLMLIDGAEPEARRFFESLPTFYRTNYVRWIEESKRPETRAKRIADAVAKLKARQREH